MNETLTVVTITYNNFDELVSTLESLPDYCESVVVNGGNCSFTKDFLEAQDCISITEEDRGISDAFNKGVKICNGDLVTFLNSGDQLIDYHYYKDSIEIFRKNSNIDFIYADLCFVDQLAGEIRIRSGKHLPHMPFLHPTLIVRRTLLEKIGIFNLEYKIAMDLDFIYRLVKSGAKGHYIPRMVVKMDGLGVSSQNYTRGYVEVMKIISRNRDFSWQSFKFVIVRTVALIFKILLLKLRGEKLLGIYRKIRYNFKT